MTIKTRWLSAGAYFYLLLPFMIFCAGFLRETIGIPLVICLGWVFLSLVRHNQPDSEIQITTLDFGIAGLILTVWVVLSGIGGFAYQNNDHQIRNAIFRDLINLPWPVYYPGASGGVGAAGGGPQYTLVYYIGYWLPAALTGKLFGWDAGQTVLFLWTLVGVFLVAVLLKKVINTSLIKVALLLIFFSGMDILGVWVMILKGVTPWLPITHLEWWASDFQYSSFTTQLFWVFNQALPVWVCLALHLATPDRKRVLLLWCLSFFYGPLPALGFLPFVLLEIPGRSFNPAQVSIKWPVVSAGLFLRNLWTDVTDTVSLENILGGSIVLGITYFYFSCNRMSSSISVLPLNLFRLAFFFFFILIEGVGLWALFYRKLNRNLAWYLAGLMLVTFPLIIVGTSIDFSMRASIPVLFMVMVWTGNGLVKQGWAYRPLLITLFLIGALTPLFEINRSVYRTVDYQINRQYYQSITPPTPQQALLLYINFIPGEDHPHRIVADDFNSLSHFKPDNFKNFVADINGSLFQKYFIKEKTR